MTDHVRVRDRKTGHEFSWPRHLVEAAGDAVELLDKPATDAATGDVAAPRHKTTVKKAAARKRRSSSRNSASKTAQPEPGQQADTQKEND